MKKFEETSATHATLIDEIAATVAKLKEDQEKFSHETSQNAKELLHLHDKLVKQVNKNHKLT